MKIINRIKNSIHNYYVLYADSTEMLEKAQSLLRPLPEGCKLVKLTLENKDLYKCTVGDLDKILQFSVLKGGECWVIVDNDEIVAFHFGMYRGNKSLFFNVKNCDYEHIEIKTDERYRRKGLAVYLLYFAIKNLKINDGRNVIIGTVIRPDNVPSIKLHKLVGFKISHKVRFFNMRRKRGNHYTFINIPRYSI